ncbi:hypothetical protein ACHHYP_08895 [Achlya hypogyna]|uniref:Uncharacterized protein n=1 Tax=Achlya hypogyna TaxID=1202772 RepID=A0A1V9YNZ9_ACHHY|nr:hypothetical protein ACHHYP_08895 [Achlya hypogyna]
MQLSMIWDYFYLSPWHTRHEAPVRHGLALHHAMWCLGFMVIGAVALRIAQYLWRPEPVLDELPKYYYLERDLVWWEYLLPLWFLDRVWTKDTRRLKYRRRHKTSSIALDTIPEDDEAPAVEASFFVRFPALKLS